MKEEAIFPWRNSAFSAQSWPKKCFALAALCLFWRLSVASSVASSSSFATSIMWPKEKKAALCWAFFFLGDTLELVRLLGRNFARAEKWAKKMGKN